MAVTKQRRREAESICENLRTWAASRADIVAVAVVGSWARGVPRMESDIDIVVLTDAPASYVSSDDWVPEAVGATAPVVRTMQWGEAMTERRVRLDSGFEVEIGFCMPTWAATSPVDPGTHEVVSGGTKALYDPSGVLALLITMLA